MLRKKTSSHLYRSLKVPADILDIDGPAHGYLIFGLRGLVCHSATMNKRAINSKNAIGGSRDEPVSLLIDIYEVRCILAKSINTTASSSSSSSTSSPVSWFGQGKFYIKAKVEASGEMTELSC